MTMSVLTTSIVPARDPIAIKGIAYGFGPRTEMLIKNLAIALLIRRFKLASAAEDKKRGTHEVTRARTYIKRARLNHGPKQSARPLKIVLTIIERGSKEEATTGNSFQTNCNAALNTLISPRPEIPDIDLLPDAFDHFVMLCIDMPTTVSQEVARDLPGLIERAKKVNLATASLTLSCVRPDGKFDITKGCMSRGEYGIIQRESCSAVIAFIDKYIPELELHFRYGTEVIGADCNNPTMPTVTLKKVGTDEPPETLSANFVYDAAGTFLASEVHPDVAKHAYTAVPNNDLMKHYLVKEELCDATGHLIEGKRLAVIGKQLSAIDYINQFAMTIGLLQWDPASKPACTVNRQLAAHYPEMLTIVSTSNRGSALPRHVHNRVWPGTAPAVLTSRQVHALRLQDGFDPAALYYEALLANLAFTLEILPRDAMSSKTTIEQLLDYAEQNRIHLTDPNPSARVRTRAALLRAFSDAVTHGLGPESDPTAAMEELSELAPLTFAPLTGWALFRNLGSKHSRPELIQTSSNAQHTKILNMFYLYNAASPVEIHHIAAELAEAGVLRHVVGRSEDFEWSEADQKHILGEYRFDGLLAPRRLCFKLDPGVNSMLPQLKEQFGVPEYAKGRLLQRKDGRVIHWIDASANTSGKEVDDKKGKKSVVSRLVADTATRAGGQELAPLNAAWIVSLCELIAKGVEKPAEELLAYHQATLPPDEEYNAEVAKFEGDWYEIREQICYLSLIRDINCTPEEYQKLYRMSFTREGRKDAVRSLAETAGVGQMAVQVYYSQLAEIEPYKPMTKDDYDACFLDPWKEQAYAVADEVYARCHLRDD